MRAFRNAALAGATALAVTFGGTTVAVAETTEQPANQATQSDGKQETATEGKQQAPAGEKEKPKASSESKIQHKIGKDLFGIVPGETSDTINGENVFGSSKDFSEENAATKFFYSLTVILGVTAILGLIIAPLQNYLKYGR